MVAETPKIYVSKSVKKLTTGEMTQDEKIAKMLKTADYMKLNMRSSDNVLNRLRLEQDITMKQMDRVLEAATQRVKDILFYSTKRLINKGNVDTIKELPIKKSKKKLVLTTDSLEDIHASIKLKEQILKRLNQENKEFNK
jgi:hypothetical protein